MNEEILFEFIFSAYIQRRKQIVTYMYMPPFLRILLGKRERKKKKDFLDFSLFKSGLVWLECNLTDKQTSRRDKILQNRQMFEYRLVVRPQVLQIVYINVYLLLVYTKTVDSVKRAF